MSSFFTRRSIASIQESLNEANKTQLKKNLGVFSVIAFGVGAIIGAGLFALTAEAAAKGAGSGIIFSFIIGAIACGFTGLCYAELATMIPVSGSAYAYTTVAMGRGPAWLVGWALLLEYMFGVSVVAIVASEYINTLLGSNIPYEWVHSPLEHLIQDGNGDVYSQMIWDALPAGSQVLNKGFVNVPAILLITVLTFMLMKGTKESAALNLIIVAIKISIIILFVSIGWQFIKSENLMPFYIDKTTYPYDGFFHHGIGGILLGASLVFFAFIGFDVVSTTVQEVKNPQRDMPRGILGSLFICVILYVLFGYVLTGVVPYEELRGKGSEASVSYAISKMKGFTWLQPFIEVAIIASFLSVVLTMLYGQSRILFTMAQDGLLPSKLTRLHTRYKTPYIANLYTLVFSFFIAGGVPRSIISSMVSFGTLFAFVAVCLSVLIMRKTHPDVPRAFKSPLVPLFPILGMLFCLVLIISLDAVTLILSCAWLLLSLVVYFVRVKKNARNKNS